MNKGYIYDSPVGKLGIIEGEQGIKAISFLEEFEENIIIEETTLIMATHQQLQEYFDGQRTEFNVPLQIEGTAFQEKCWKALLTIPYGETWTYKQLAIAVGNENASRAVGNANNKNKIAIIIPCHRVIGSSGKLVGYAGGLDKKEYLLGLEQ